MILDDNDAVHFQFFAKQIKTAVTKYGSLNRKELVKIQKEQVDGLSKLEIDFKKRLLKHKKVADAFDIFYDYILNEKKNLLFARPFFRERHVAFGQGIMESIKNRNYLDTCKFHFNYHLIRMIMQKVDFKDPNLTALFSKIMEARQRLVLMNLPFVISRAKIFFSRTSKSHLSFMDLVQIGVCGLISAIDKYCGRYARMWRGVALGRMGGDFIKEYSETTIHFYPEDRRRLYRANKFLSRNIEGEYSEEDLTKKVNEFSESGPPVDAEQIRQILQAASTVSVDTRLPLDDNNVSDENITRMEAPEDTRPDVRVEKFESIGLMRKYLGGLSVLDKKLLKLKGIDF